MLIPTDLVIRQAIASVNSSSSDNSPAIPAGTASPTITFDSPVTTPQTITHVFHTITGPVPPPDTVAVTPTESFIIVATDGPIATPYESSRVVITGSTVVIIILSLLLTLFIGLFIWKLRQERAWKRAGASLAAVSEKHSLQGLAFKPNLSTTSPTLTAKIGSDQTLLKRTTSTTTRASSNASSYSRSTSSYPLATASYAFIPTRPDETSLLVGERVHVLASFDDGRACVANSEGARGMVPCECLDIFLLDDESEVWDNYTDVMEKRRSAGSDVTHQTNGTARTGYSERSSSLAFGDVSDASSVSTRSGDILWMVSRQLRGV